ncbi:MAG: hydrogenase maturation protease [Armatimonadota bacterium]|nr:hydrogenase maturation protease [Armatimonadota bacterium]
MKKQNTLLIGVGNPYRQDDAAGIAVVRRLRQRPPKQVDCMECPGDLTTLIETWRGYEKVIVVDAMSSGRSVGEVVRFDLSQQPLPTDVRFFSTHAMGLGEVIELARRLQRLPPQLVVYGIEGKHFGEGEGLSPEVAKAVEDVVRYILQELKGSDA